MIADEERRLIWSKLRLVYKEQTKDAVSEVEDESQKLKANKNRLLMQRVIHKLFHTSSQTYISQAWLNWKSQTDF